MRRAVIALGILIGGCAVGPDYRRPALDLPDTLRGAETAAAGDSVADQTWWGLYGDPTLR